MTLRKIVTAVVFLTGATAGWSGENPAPWPAAAVRRLTLTEAVSLFSDHNHDLISARLAVDSARADVVTAGQRPNPTLSFNSSSISSATSSAAGRYWDKKFDNVVRIEQPFERGNKRELRAEAADAALVASRGDLQDTRRQLLMNLYSSYYDLLLAQEKERINGESVSLYGKTLAATELRLRAGDIAHADVTRIRVEALKAQNDARQAEADREKAQVALGYMLGIGSHSGQITAIDPWPTLEDKPNAISFEDVVSKRPDVKAADVRIRAADKNLQLAGALRKRDITLGLQYEHFPPDAQNTFGIGISIPLFTGYGYEGEIRRAETTLSAAQENFEKVKAQASGEIIKARADLDAAAERLKRFDEELLPQAQKAMDAAEFAYRHGAMGVLDLIDARRTLHAISLDAAAARADYAKSQAAWAAAITSEAEGQ